MKSAERRTAARGIAWTGALIGAAGLLGLFASPAATAAEASWTRCDGGESDVSCGIVRGIATAPASATLPGAVYAASQGGKSIEKFTVWGEFLRRWGWDVVESGPGDNGAGFEICAPADGDICKAGVQGSGAGQFASPQGVALDSAANVYVVDRPNRRIQQFSATGQFLRMWGKGVNTGTSGNPDLCTNAGPPTDVCGIASEGTGPGQFGEWTILNTLVAVDTKATATTADDKVYVGDKGRIQLFNAGGEFQSQITAGLTATESVKSLAVDKAGNLYAAIEGKPGVRKWNSSGTFLGEKFKALTEPVSLAFDPADTANRLHAIDGSSNATIRKFSAAEVELDKWGQEEPPSPKLGSPTGLAAGSACLENLTKGSDVYVTNPSPAFARAYGPRPELCPKPEVPPTILAQFATSVGARTATLQAQINPHFFEDTTYFLRYATAACIEAGGWEAACVQAKPAPPGPTLAAGGDLAEGTAPILLTGLAPSTDYRFRFLTESGGGGPVQGPERSFRTFADSSPGAEPCPNDLFRIGASTLLPDCRAYEMVSPIEKEGADIKTNVNNLGNPTARNQSALSGNKLTYSAEQPFGDAESQPFTSQYIASRSASGWATEAISPPRGVLRGSVGSGSDNEFKAFTEDLCGAFLVTDDTTASPLVAGGKARTNNLYRREGCSGSGYRWLGWGKLSTNIDPLEVQGTSADGSRAAFRTEAHLSQEAATQTGVKLKCSTPAVAEAVAFKWLRNGTPIGGATASEYTAAPADAGSVVQCQVTASNANGGATGITNPAWVIDPYPGAEPPLAPQSMAAPLASAPLLVGGAGGQTLHCEAGEWGGAPGFAYRWYRNGAQIAEGPEPDYAVQAADLASPAAFQCAAIATNAGGGVAASSANLPTSPAPSEPAVPAVEARGGDNPAMAYLAGGGALRSVCVLPGGRKLNLGCSAGMLAGPLFNGYGANLANAVSADSKRVYWTASGNFGGPDKIYLRENADQPQSALDGEGNCTEAGKACTAPVVEAEAQFWAASRDGARALYRTGSLTATGKLFEFEAASGESHEIAGGVSGLLGASDDATRAYLVSTEALDAGAVAGEPNLYLYEATGGFTFIAVLANGDLELVADRRAPSPLSALPVGHTSRVSADGSAAAFTSVGQPTGYDNTDAKSGEADREVYLYRVASGELKCVSCNPSGARPQGRHVEEDGKDYWAAAEISGAQHSLYFPRNLSADGTRLYFESYEALVPADSNAKRDVYEWEAAGKGSCSAASPAFSVPAGGCVSLISSGRDGHDSEFADAGPSGDDVFFRTAESLVGSDPGQFDIYDARVLGGFPQPRPAPPCEGDACQSQAAPPALLSPASSAFRGAGNVAPRKGCLKGKRRVRRAGKTRCVRRHGKGQRKSGRARR